MKNTFKGTNNDIRELMIFAFRYALGRASMAPYGVTEAIKPNIHLLSEFDKEQMIKDIEQAIECDRAGMHCDVNLWSNFITYLKGSK